MDYKSQTIRESRAVRSGTLWGSCAQRRRRERLEFCECLFKEIRFGLSGSVSGYVLVNVFRSHSVDLDLRLVIVCFLYGFFS